MMTRLGSIVLLALALAAASGAGCSSTATGTDGGMGGAPGAGGATGAAGASGMGGMIGRGGSTGAGGIGVDAAADQGSDTVAGDAGDAAPAATFTQVWSTVLIDVTGNAAPGCIFCHDGTPGIPEYTNKALAYSTLVGKPSTSCPGRTRVIAGNAADSVLVNKLRAHAPFNSGMICGGQPMPFSDTRFITADQLALIESWINAGALDN